MGREKTEKGTRTGGSSTKAKSARDTKITNATALGLAKKTRSFSIVITNRACSNRESKKDKYDDGMPESVSRVHILMESTYYRCGQRKELL